MQKPRILLIDDDEAVTHIASTGGDGECSRWLFA